MTPNPLFFAKIFYFFFYAAWACLLPFLALYYQSLGFSGSQIGLLSSISPLITLFAAPFWSGLADASRRHKRILLATLFGTGAAVFLISLSRSFLALVPMVALYAFFTAPVIPLVDSSVINLLGDHPERYGSQRLWGAIGWGIAGPVAGRLTETFGLSFSFYGYLTLAAFALLAVLRLPIHSAAPRSAYWNGLRKLLADRRWYVFLLIVFLSGIGFNVVHSFLFLHMSNLDASNTTMGLALTVATISEVPVLFFSGFMLRRWGMRGLMLASLAFYVFRAFGLAFASEPWHVLLLQLTHGLTFSAMLVAGVSFASQMAPPGLGATAQGVFSSTMTGFGGITGALVGGVLFQQFGGKGLYAASGAVVLIGLLLFVLFQGKQEQANST